MLDFNECMYDWWMIHLGDVVTDVICIQKLYQIKRYRRQRYTLLIFGRELACAGFGVNNVTDDFGADINGNFFP